jgi:hypothetical protein
MGNNAVAADGGLVLTTMATIDFTHLSPRNAAFKKRLVTVANGATFVVLDMTEDEKRQATNVIYLHVHRESRKCYVGITVQEAGKRWFSGTTYRLNRRFGRALEKHGWDAFDSRILAFAENRDSLNRAEVAAIAAAGGHKSRHTYNLSPGGDTVADNNIPIVGVFLPTGEVREFTGGSEASRLLGLGSTDAPMAVIRGELAAARDWWFRLAGDDEATPPLIWGEPLRLSKLRELKARPLVAINYASGESRRFETQAIAAEALGINQSEVGMVANGKSHSAGGWWFRFEDEDRQMPSLRGHQATRAKRDKKVYATHLKTGERCEFRNCTVADQDLGIYEGGAAAVASGKRVSADDWWFSYDIDEQPPADFKFALVAKARSKPVVATEIATGRERRFESAKAAAETLGMSRASICYVISGKLNAAKGYKFRFA